MQKRIEARNLARAIPQFHSIAFQKGPGSMGLLKGQEITYTQAKGGVAYHNQFWVIFYSLELQSEMWPNV